MHTNIISRYNWESTKKNRYLLSRKPFREYKWELDGLLFVRSIYAILIGILTTLFFHWNFFFIAVGLYCLFKSIIVFTLIKRSKLTAAELEEEGGTLTSTQRAEISSQSNRYAFVYAFVGFYLSFTMITCVGALTKWMTEVFFNLF